MLDRRTFLKTGCTATLAFAFTGMVGCSSGQQSASDAVDSQENSIGAESTESTTSDTQSSSSEAATASTTGVAVVYFSCTGNTEAVAEKIAGAVDGTLMRIEPAQPYTSADLDYNSDCRANTEQNDVSARPAIASPAPDVSGCDTVYLGYPIWWGTAPKIILTFLEGADFGGKTIIPFCTSGGSGIAESESDIETAAPNANWLDGERFSSSVSQSEVDSWVAGISS